MTESHDPAAEVAGPHGPGDHGDDPSHGHDDHAHDDMGLGPIDWTMWATGVVAALVALGVVVALAVSTGFAFGA